MPSLLSAIASNVPVPYRVTPPSLACSYLAHLHIPPPHSLNRRCPASTQAAKVLIHKYNTQLATTLEGRTELLQQLLGGMDAADPPFIEPPFYCDYGYNIHMGSSSYANFGLTVLDACRVDIGKRVLIGPNVQVRRRFVLICATVCICTAPLIDATARTVHVH
jgi:acetyltransferase-like isoleucine patch superfamily enzyme